MIGLMVLIKPILFSKENTNVHTLGINRHAIYLHFKGLALHVKFISFHTMTRNIYGKSSSFNL